MSGVEAAGDEEAQSGTDGITFVTDRPDSPVARLMDWIGVGLFVLLLVLGTVQVVVRFITAPYFGVNVAWTGEASRFTLIYATMIGSIIAARDSDHIQIEIVLERLPRRFRRAARFVVRALGLAFLVVAAYGSYLSTLDNVDVAPGAVPYITLEFVYVSLVIGFVGMAIYELRWLAVDVGLLGDSRRETDE